MPMRFDGKVGIVTGGASGIGEGIVRRLVAEGARCLIADVQEDRGRALAGELGEAARFMRADVSVEADVAALVDAAVSELGWPGLPVQQRRASRRDRLRGGHQGSAC